MQITKTAANKSALTLGLGAIALAVSAAQANPLQPVNVRVGASICGTVQLVKQNSVEVELVDYIDNGTCNLAGGNGGGDGDGTGGGDGDGDGTGGGDGDGDGTGGGDGDGDGTGGGDGDGSGDALAGGVKYSGWGSAVFPVVPQAFDNVNVRKLSGEMTKYSYFELKTSMLANQDYSGKINMVTTTGSRRADFSMWISRSPGGAPIVGQAACNRPLAGNSTLRWSTNYPGAKSYNCKLEKTGTYFLNVSDRNYEDLVANRSGTCIGSSACEFGIGINSIDQ